MDAARLALLFSEIGTVSGSVLIAAPASVPPEEVRAAARSAGIAGDHDGVASVLRARGAARVAEWTGDGAAPAGAFDLVVDLAYLPRRLDMPDALAELLGRVAPGGRIVHVAPSSNHMDEVYYMLSPTLFQDFYGANGWIVESLRVARERPRGLDVFSYEPGRLDPISHGGLDAARYLVLCVARREAAAALDRVPQQGLYARAWRATAPSMPAAVAGGATGHGFAAFVRNNRILYRMAYRILTPRKRRRLMARCLPLVRRMAW